MKVFEERYTGVLRKKHTPPRAAVAGVTLEALGSMVCRPMGARLGVRRGLRDLGLTVRHRTDTEHKRCYVHFDGDRRLGGLRVNEHVSDSGRQGGCRYGVPRDGKGGFAGRENQGSRSGAGDGGRLVSDRPRAVPRAPWAGSGRFPTRYPSTPQNGAYGVASPGNVGSGPIGILGGFIDLA